MIIFATMKHSGQVCKGGKPYILHPLAVMGQVTSIAAKVVAAGHDLLEDTDATKDDLKAQGCSEEIIQAIMALTKLKGERRVDSAHRIVSNRLACEVKLADVAHNMDLSRLPAITDKDLSRLEEYKMVQLILENAKSNNWNNFQ
ncbi:guanosine-3',5'-bis(diphosphate) 3'-pyrophosphohydrolase [Acinetobacter sp. TGL-Y2]|uniref:guanosine-3',5'-bis(diphosphate) 3'-pyrophosphohydrolase n=1 Tax=Acinetobacter sp. TGL-Y2 TaxID=1407071 RepID=UPI003A0FF520